MKYSIALLIALAAGPATAQPVPVPQFGLPTPSVFSSKIGFFTPDRIEGANYPRVIQLKIGPNKGALLATFGRRGSLPIFRSTDNGDSWQQFSEVPQLTGQPCLYELPVKMGEFAAGTVMACGTGPAGQPGGKHTLDVAVSQDGGKSWATLSTIATGGGGRYDPMDRAGLLRDQEPVFEPYLLADAQNRLVAYFSDERDKKSGYSQLLDHEVSTDGGKTWSTPVYDVAIPDGLSRPGMAIVARDAKGKFYMSYELVSAPGYALEPRTNSAHFAHLDGWRELGRCQKPRHPDPGSLAAVSQWHALYRLVALGRARRHPAGDGTLGGARRDRPGRPGHVRQPAWRRGPVVAGRNADRL